MHIFVVTHGNRALSVVAVGRVHRHSTNTLTQLFGLRPFTHKHTHILFLTQVGGPKAQIRDQQVACAVTAHGPASVSLSGEIHIFDPANPDNGPARTVQGHQATPISLALDAAGNPATGCMEGVVCRWVDGFARRIDGTIDARDATKVHKGGVQGLTYHAGSLVSAGAFVVLCVFRCVFRCVFPCALRGWST